MLIVDGYKMFRGSAIVTPVSTKFSPFLLSGTWLYKPDQDCWYCQPEKGFSRSYPAEIISDIEEE